MIWFIENYNVIQYIIYKYLGIDISLFTNYEKLVVIIGCNLMALLTLFITIYIIKHLLYKYLTLIG